MPNKKNSQRPAGVSGPKSAAGARSGNNLPETQGLDAQAYLNLLISRMPVGLIVWDKEFRVQTWNPEAEKIFGFTEAEARGKHPYDFIVPRSAQPQVAEVWGRLMQGDLAAHSKNENLTKDGRTVICDWYNTPLKESSGRVIGVLSMAQDITQREKIQQALEEEEQRYRVLAENVSDVIWTMDMQMHMTYISPSVTQVFGYTPKELMSMKLEEYLEPESYRQVLQTIRQDLQSLTTHSKIPPSRMLVIREKRKDGTWIWTEIKANFVFNDQGKPVEILGVSRDINDRKKTEERLNASIKELQQTNSVMVDRELKMIELKKEIAQLKAKLN